ncbi:insecticidal delta-endotoxin Cry8Ea1 family protein [Bacillus toyonensis]|uniref:insecticidal delta-endotoxin Cry8Ea1 family protein n=1 Tax=Bacillus toyonensis TaxID=155322 RepID=UPI002156159B|nr:insecticidal delta-endotoxin Cry8Ea1 family protein [Bacillus toyonensis]MEE2018650.1 insecticidal delta-endotoxin Cry8Ea1 family protein [Bacillus toyonensis]
MNHFQNVIPELVNSCPPDDCDYYNILVLSSYAQVANLHLTVLNQAVKFEAYLKNNRQFDYLEPLPTAIDYYPVLTKAIEDYTNHCVTTYKKGLNLIKTTPDSNLNGNINWNTYNTYRTKMTTSVLDLVALFPNFDVGKYPIGVQSELTREIYQVLNFEESPYKYYDFQYQEDSLTRRPHLFTWLDSLNFYEKAQTTPNNFFTSHYNMFHYTLDNKSQKSSVFGNQNVTDRLKSLDLATNIYIFLLNVTSLDNKYLNDYNNISKMDFFITNGTRLLEKDLTAGSGQINSDVNKNIFGLPILKRRENQGIPTLFPTYDNYSHILSFIKSLSIPATYKTQVYTFAWTHSSVDPKNTIYTHLTTQIPAVKATLLGTATTELSKVVQGPGHTGGDLIDFKDRFKIICQHSNSQQSYFVRIRYASNGSANTRAAINLSIPGVAELDMALNPTFSGTDYTNLKYKDFQYLEFLDEVKFGPNQNLSLVFNRLDVYTNTTVLIDKIEFLPITRSIREDREKQKLETVQQIINTFFVNSIKNTLKSEITDYDIDQAAKLVESLSEEIYPQKKIILLDEIKYAKQLSYSRNLLQNGDFNDLIDWKTSNDITIKTGNPNFKASYLDMSETSNTLFPTYIHQKIDESKLKPYTRYQVRGFVRSSKDLELTVTRYGKEIDVIMNVPNDLVFMQSNSSYGDYNSCETLPNPVMNQGNSTLLTDGYATDISSCQPKLGKKHVTCHDSHPFDFHIDTGELDINTNLGIWVLFKISNPNGYATLGNLEVIEEGPLTGEALAHVKQKEMKWKQHMEKKRMETQQAYDPAKQAVDALFTNTQGEELHYHTTLDQIKNADHLVRSIPYVHHAWLPDVPGMNDDLYNNLKVRIEQARYLYDARNVITNGDFAQGLTGWHATGKAAVQQMDGASVLVLSNWSAEVSQNLHVQDHCGYVLRVIAKKEGPGKGYVTMMDCNGNQETLTFTSCEGGYMTKTVEVFPESDRVRIEIGETEGTFYIESIELLCMKG